MQVKLAKELNKPLIIHSRDVKEDVLDTILEAGFSAKGVFHCFDGDKAYLEKLNGRYRKTGKLDPS